MLGLWAIILMTACLYAVYVHYLLYAYFAIDINKEIINVNF